MIERVRSLVSVAAIMWAASLMLSGFPVVTAAVGDGKTVIYACKNNLTAALRQVTSASCMIGETSVQWRQGPEDGTEFPFVCVNCALYNQSMFQGRNYTGALLTGADFTNDPLGGTNFTEAQITNANFTNTSLAGANFTNTVLTGTNFTGATGMDSATLTGADWDSTTCPDGTDSEDNGDTCVGHLTP